MGCPWTPEHNGAVMSAVRHTAKTVAVPEVPGTWRSICSCGWKGKTQGAKGARDAAISERYRHIEDVSA